MPTLDLVKLAMRSNPTEATEEMKDAMDILLNLAIPAVEPKVMKRKSWIAGETTHREFLGKSWKSDFASAFILLQFFSKTAQIYRNLGFWDKENHRIPKDQRVEGGPERKERGKDVTKSTEEKIGALHSAHLVWLKELFESEGAKERMDAWDTHCCSGRGKRKANDEAVNTVPEPAATAGYSGATEDPTQQLLDSTKLLVNGEAVEVTPC